MKYKVISIFAIIFVFVIAMFANSYIVEMNPNRTEQHLTYAVNDNCKGTDEFCTHLPLVNIETKGEIPNEEPNQKGTFSLVYNENTSNRLNDAPLMEENIEIRNRGNSSLNFDKHQYLVKFVNKKGEDKNVSILGMQKENKWILNGPYLDKTLIRNYMIYNLAGKLLKATPEVRFCELYVNGEYQGVYLIIETISRELTGITEYKKKWTNGISSYIVRMDRAEEDNKLLNNFTKYTGKIIPENSINVIYPTEKKLTPDMMKYINDDFSKFEKSLYSYDFDEYSKYIDVDSFVDYMLINEFFKNADAGTYSTYLYKDIRGKITMGPVWDFNNSMNNYVEKYYSKEDFMFQDKIWYDMLLKDERFTEKVIKRYRYLRKNILSDKYLQDYITDTIKYLGPAIDRNFEVWGYTFTKQPLPHMLYPYSRNYESYDEAVTQIREFIKERGDWLDENIDALKQYSHYSIKKQYVGD